MYQLQVFFLESRDISDLVVFLLLLRLSVVLELAQPMLVIEQDLFLVAAQATSNENSQRLIKCRDRLRSAQLLLVCIAADAQELVVVSGGWRGWLAIREVREQ